MNLNEIGLSMRLNIAVVPDAWIHGIEGEISRHNFCQCHLDIGVVVERDEEDLMRSIEESL